MLSRLTTYGVRITFPSLQTNRQMDKEIDIYYYTPLPIIRTSNKQATSNTSCHGFRWGLTVTILAQSFDLGGTRLVPPRVLLQWQNGQAFVKFFKSPQTFPAVISRAYHNWATPLGIYTSLANFHLFQLGTVKLSGLPFIGLSALSFSKGGF